MRNIALLFIFSLFLMPLTSCLDDDDQTKENNEWKVLNDEFFANEANKLDDNGQPYYTVLTPEWAPGYKALVKWHTPRRVNALKPMDNSVCYMKYEVRNIDGEMLDNSYSLKTYGDSIYRTKPLSNIAGVWFTLTQMSEGDSVTAVIPQDIAYGQYGYGNIKPYSTLIFKIKLKKIVAWEIPN